VLFRCYGLSGDDAAYIRQWLEELLQIRTAEPRNAVAVP
jgi:hypothetical protein